MSQVNCILRFPTHGVCRPVLLISAGSRVYGPGRLFPGSMCLAKDMATASVRRKEGIPAVLIVPGQAQSASTRGQLFFCFSVYYYATLVGLPGMGGVLLWAEKGRMIAPWGQNCYY